MFVRMENISKSFAQTQILDRVSFSIEEGKLVGLLGLSGSGKTTILRILAGLESADQGDIFIDNRRVNDIAPGQRGIGFVFQNYSLFHHMTVYQNIAFGLEIQKMNRKDIQKRVTELIALTGLQGKEKSYPSQLSGGQRQRVAFARAIAPNPRLLLLDEPFAAIDAKIRQELRTWLREMVTQLGITRIFVTHDQDEAIEVADEIIITNQGTIEQIGSPHELYQNPKTAFVASFFGKGDILSAQDLSQFPELPEKAKLIVRPEFVRITRQEETRQYESTVTKAKVVSI